MSEFLTNMARLFREMRDYLLGGTLEPLPIRKVLRRYSLQRMGRDLTAGTNVALLAIPQGMAFAMMAGLDNVAYGIICSAVAATIAPLFSSSRHTVLGPTNATALMVFSALAGRSAAAVEVLPVLIFISGTLLVVGAYLRMADLLQYISRSVIVGYVTGASALIIAGQMRDVLGIAEASGDPAAVARKARTFFSIVADTLGQVTHLDLGTVVVSGLTIGVYLVLRRVNSRMPALALTLVLMTCLVMIAQRIGLWQGVAHLSGFDISRLAPRIPDLRSPQTLDQVALLFGPAFAIAFTSGLENSVMSKSLASRCGDRPDANQDMLSVGVANLASAFLSHMPASGSLTRSTLNFESGATSQISSLFCGLICGVGALTLGSAVSYIPRCSLAVLVMVAALALINRRNLRICLRATRSDGTTLIATIAATLLLPLHVAIFVGVATSIILYLRKAARPMLVEYEFNTEGDLTERSLSAERQTPQISIVHVEGELFFGAAELFRTQIQRTVVDPNLRVIILRMKNARHLDATSVMALEELILFLRSKNRHLIISGASKQVYRVIRNSGLLDVVGRDNFFMGSPQNPNLSTRNALKRAQVLLGTSKADVRIFFDPQHPRGD